MAPRIVTLTANPALDVAMDVPFIQAGHKLRATGETYDPGGGGINVSRVIRALGGKTMAIFTRGGATGRQFRQLLRQEKVPCVSIPIAGTTRVSVTIHEKTTGAEYRFVPDGPELQPADGDRILSILSDVQADWLVASGSLPRGLPQDFYARVAHLAGGRNIRFALDTSGGPLKAALHHGVDLLKTSCSEFESITTIGTTDRQALAREACRLTTQGAARMIAITLGEEGSILATPEGHWFRPAASVQVRSSVGAGDSFLAGLVLALARGQSVEDALRLAAATAAAAVSQVGTARVDARLTEELLGIHAVDAGQSAARHPV